MKLLLDTHALLWWLEGSAQLSARARRTISDRQNDVFVSAASAWEISIKAHAGKLQVGSLLSDFVKEIEEEGLTELPITATHAVRAGLLAGAHKDPFDRMLIAQAQAENLAVISKDTCFDAHAVRRIW